MWARGQQWKWNEINFLFLHIFTYICIFSNLLFPKFGMENDWKILKWLFSRSRSAWMKFLLVCVCLAHYSAKNPFDIYAQLLFFLSICYIIHVQYTDFPENAQQNQHDREREKKKLICYFNFDVVWLSLNHPPMKLNRMDAVIRL